MLSLIQKKSWFKDIYYMMHKIPKRNIPPICGPPSYPMSTAQKIIICGGSMLLMMVIPIWGLLSLPSWSRKHQNLGKARKDINKLEGLTAE